MTFSWQELQFVYQTLLPSEKVLARHLPCSLAIFCSLCTTPNFHVVKSTKLLSAYIHGTSPTVSSLFLMYIAWPLWTFSGRILLHEQLSCIWIMHIWNKAHHINWNPHSLEGNALSVLFSYNRLLAVKIFRVISTCAYMPDFTFTAFYCVLLTNDTTLGYYRSLQVHIHTLYSAENYTKTVTRSDIIT